MTSQMKLMLLVGASALVLTACGGGGDVKITTPPPVVVVPVPGQGTLENMFGVGFGALFRADANTDATEPKDSDLINLTLIEDAVAVP